MSKEKSLNYTSYLALEEILGAQRPVVEGDEVLFIVVHQVYELWFKQLIHSFGTCSGCSRRGTTRARSPPSSASDDPQARRRPAGRDRDDDAGAVPRVPGPARGGVGFQSGQFRELEAILGRRDPGVLDAYHEGGVDYRVKAAMARPSVYDSFLHYLAARGYEVPEEILQRDVTQPVEESAGVQAALLEAYRDDSEPAQVAERMVDFDEGLMEWRYHHVKMVERTIGSRPGTGGSAAPPTSGRRSTSRSSRISGAVRSEL